MSQNGNQDFTEWVVENNLDEQDLKLIQRTAAKRAWLLFLFSWTTVALPLFLREWRHYKIVKQRTLSPYLGLIYRIFAFGQMISFLAILPIIPYAIFSRSFWLSGMDFLMKHQFVGAGAQGRRNYEAYKELRKRPRIIKAIVCVGSTVLLTLAFYLLGLSENAYASMPISEVTEIFVSFVISVFALAEIIGMIVYKIVVNKKYNKWRNGQDA